MSLWFREIRWPRNSRAHQALKKAGFNHFKKYGSTHFSTLEIRELPTENIERAKQVIRKTGPSKEELLYA